MLRSDVPGYPCRRGKVRDVYDLGDRLAIVATDRISAFDWVMPTAIPGKGSLLTAMSRFWFKLIPYANHLIDELLPAAFAGLEDRTMLVRKTNVVPIECVARGYLAGSGWKEYQRSRTVCGLPLPDGLKDASRLPTPIFTPATKAESGHDENIPFERMADEIGVGLAEELRERTLNVYKLAAKHAETCGIILADTKFEWGLVNGEIILIDEVLTPDSSRFWPMNAYAEGSSPPSFDKQYLRNWLESVGWDKSSPPPALPEDVVNATAAKYREAFTAIVGVPPSGGLLFAGSKTA